MKVSRDESGASDADTGAIHKSAIVAMLSAVVTRQARRAVMICYATLPHAARLYAIVSPLLLLPPNDAASLLLMLRH